MDADDRGMVDIWVALAASFALAFVVAGPRARRASHVPPSERARGASKDK